MRRIVAGITTLEEHLETIRQKPEVYRRSANEVEAAVDAIVSRLGALAGS